MKIHSGEKVHECVGSLKNGETWGCRRKFARADKLKQHHQSDTGRRCMQPLYDEQAHEQEEERMERERIIAEEVAKELERIKAEERAALEQVKEAESEEARQRIRAEEAAKELELIKAEERAALEQAKQAKTEEAGEHARKYANAMEQEWKRIQAEEEARKKAQADAEEQRRSHVPVHIPDIEVSSLPPTEGSTPLPPFSTLTRSISENESDGWMSDGG